MKIFIEIIAIIICFSIVSFFVISYKKTSLKLKKIKAIKNDETQIKISKSFLFAKKGDYPIEFVKKIMKRINLALIINAIIFVVLFVVLVLCNITFNG